MFLRRSLVHIIYMYMIFFLCRYIWGLAPPPPHTKKLATLLLPAFAHQKSGQMKMADSVPPPPPLATRNRRHCKQGSLALYKRQYTDKTLTFRKSIYMCEGAERASSENFRIFTFSNCYFSQYFVGTSKTLSVQISCLPAYMYRQIFKCSFPFIYYS